MSPTDLTDPPSPDSLATADGMSLPRVVPTATARLLEGLLPDIRRVARRLSHNWEDADDLVQDTLFRLWAQMADPDVPSSQDVRGMAFSALRNRANARACNGCQAPGAPPEDVPPPSGGRRPDRVSVLSAIDALPPDQAHLVRLRAIEGLSYEQITKETGLSIGAVTARLARGRAAVCERAGLNPDTPVSTLLDDL